MRKIALMPQKRTASMKWKCRSRVAGWKGSVARGLPVRWISRSIIIISWQRVQNEEYETTEVQ